MRFAIKVTERKWTSLMMLAWSGLGVCDHASDACVDGILVLDEGGPSSVEEHHVLVDALVAHLDECLVLVDYELVLLRARVPVFSMHNTSMPTISSMAIMHLGDGALLGQTVGADGHGDVMLPMSTRRRLSMPSRYSRCWMRYVMMTSITIPITMEMMQKLSMDLGLGRGWLLLGGVE